MYVYVHSYRYIATYVSMYSPQLDSEIQFSMWVLSYLLLVAIDFSRDSPAAMPMSKEGMSLDKGNSTSDSEVIPNVKVITLEDKKHQPESNLDSTTL